MNHASTLYRFFIGYEYISIIFLFIANSSYVLILILGYINARKQYLRTGKTVTKISVIAAYLKPISVLVPSYNEELSIIDSVSSMLRLNYPEYEVIVVNDGSKDKTLEKLIEHFKLKSITIQYNKIIPTNDVRNVYQAPNHPNLLVIDKENGGKADALNTGINFSKYPLICCVDSDSIFDESGLLQIATPFFEDPEHVVAVGGTIRVANGSLIAHGKVVEPKITWNYFSLIQTVEYLRAFLVGRMGWDFIGANSIISGAFGLFKREAVINVGGYGRNSIGEDLELLLKIHQHYIKENKSYSVKFLPNPICWTEVPTDFKSLGNQRSRWQQGLLEGLWASRWMMLRPKAGVIGMVALPYLFLFEMISAPLELFGYIIILLSAYLGISDPHMIIAFFVVSIGYGWIITLGALLIEEMTFQKYQNPKDFLKLLAGVGLEQLGFRQIHLFWRLRGIVRKFTGNRAWGKITRRGFKKV